MIIDNLFRKIKLSFLNNGSDTIKIKIPLLRKIQNVLQENKQITVLLIDIPELHIGQNVNERKQSRQMLQSIQKYLYHSARLYFYPGKIIATQKFSEDMIVTYISHKTRLADYELRLRIKEIKESLINKIIKITSQDVSIKIGYDTLEVGNMLEIEKYLFSSIKNAFQSLNQEQDWAKDNLIEELVLIMENKNFNMVYQPLVSLRTGTIYGYESLTRGPANHHFYYPDNLFPFAEETGFLLQLERITRELAIKNFTGDNTNLKLFININPLIINDPHFTGGETLQLIKQFNLLPQNIVFEITERTAIKDFNSFKQAILHYRDQGFMVAIDDAGSGYSSLQSIAELKPDFIKVDRSLVSDIDKDMVKKSLMETFVTFADKINSKILAEGIETEEEMKVLLEMGVTFGQGYFLAKPGNPLPTLESQALKLFADYFRNLPDENSIYRQLRDITADTMRVHRDTLIKHIANYFTTNEHAKSVIVMENTQPIGIIMRDKLFKYLGIQYGVALYWEKPVTLIMDANPLIIEARIPLITASEIAVNRPSQKLYDDIVVTENHDFIGVVPVQQLLNELHK